MFGKIKKQKISILAVHNLNGKKVFYGCSENGSAADLFLAEKSGANFVNAQEVNVFSENGKVEKLHNCSDFKFFHSGERWYLTFSHEYSRFFFKRRETVMTKSSNMLRYDVIDREDNWDLAAFSSVTGHTHKNNFLAYFGGKTIRAAASKDLKKWHFSGDLLSPRQGYFDEEPLHVIDALMTRRGILVLYESKKTRGSNTRIKIGGALFALDQPYKLIWRSKEALLEKFLPKGSRKLKYIGCLVEGDVLELHWVVRGTKIMTAKVQTVIHGMGSLKERSIHLKRSQSNPIIKPKAENSWEYDSTFNPAAIYLDDKVHLIYRAIGANGVSVLGYASSEDGLNVNERLDQPAFAAANFASYAKDDQSLCPSKYVSGGSWIGCEDPRITKMTDEDRIYMTYTSFDGYNPPGVALTWIDAKDFLSKKWTWKRSVLISRPGQIQKNWMLFPEKIGGKYAILHSITPQVLIEYVDDLEKEGLVIDSYKKPGREEKRWDNIIRGAGAPPIKTEYGWLVLYHAMDKKDPNRYKVGAMILDYTDPTKVLYRANCPVLEPDEIYENYGAKAGVVYVCGAVIKDDTLFVYYGGADSVVCVATADIKAFLQDISCHVVKNLVARKAIAKGRKVIETTGEKLPMPAKKKAITKVKAKARVRVKTRSKIRKKI